MAQDAFFALAGLALFLLMRSDHDVAPATRVTVTLPWEWLRRLFRRQPGEPVAFAVAVELAGLSWFALGVLHALDASQPLLVAIIYGQCALWAIASLIWMSDAVVRGRRKRPPRH